MKIKKIKGGSAQRLILTGMIVNRRVLSAVASRWEEPGLFNDKYGNLIGSWCVDYYNKYDKSPGMSIQTIFNKWKAKTKDKETSDSIATFLSGISDEYETTKKKLNASFVIDEAQAFFKKAQLKELKNAIEEDLDNDDLEAAYKRIHEINPVQIDTQVGIDIFNDKAAIQEAAENPEADILIRYPGALGSFYEDTFSRGHLVSFMAQEKGGKTFQLIDVAWRGIQAGYNVAFFAVGDMTQKQMMRRLFARACKRPFKPQSYYVPTSLEAGDPPEPVLEKKKCTDFIPYNQALERMKKMSEKYGKNKFRLFTYANSTLSVMGLKSVLLSERRRGWVPDIVVIDYADILAPVHGPVDSRESINMTWKTLRAIAHDTLVVTATQAKATAYTEETLGKKDFSEDKRKFAHVVAMIGINSLDAEKEKGLSRLNFIVARENEFVETKCVYVSGSLALCNPNMFSSF